MTGGDVRRELQRRVEGKDVEIGTVIVLIEIAAQLAEANALARFELGLEDKEGTP